MNTLDVRSPISIFHKMNSDCINQMHVFKMYHNNLSSDLLISEFFRAFKCYVDTME